MKKGNYGRYPKRRIWIADLIALTLSCLTALFIRYDNWVDRFDRLYITLIVSMWLIQTLIFVIVDLRSRSVFESDPIENLVMVVRDRTLVMFLSILYLYVTQQGEVSSRFVIATVYVTGIVYDYILRMVIRSIYLKKNGLREEVRALEICPPYPSSEDLRKMIADPAETDNEPAVLIRRGNASDEDYNAMLDAAAAEGARVYAGLDIDGYDIRSGIASDVNGFLTVPVSVRRNRFELLGVRYAIARTEEAVLHVIRNLRELGGRYICFSNVHTLVMSVEDPSYRDILNNSALTFADGNPIAKRQIASGLVGAERVAGPDFMDHFFRDTADGQVSHFFYGSSQETLDALQSNLKKKYPDINIKGMYSPPFRDLTPEEDAADVERINASGADVVWIGLGAPKQEKWMADHAGRINGVMMGVGAGFDFHAGTIKRAPIWVQKVGMEWFYRLCQDPGRLFKRYVVTNIKFYIYLLFKNKKVNRGKTT